MFVKFITSKLLRVIVCAAAGLYGLYNVISCFVTLYKAGHQPYLMAGAVRFDFQGYYMMAAMHVGICLLLGVLVWLFLKGTKKLRKKTAVLCVIGVKGHTKARKGGNDHETGM